MEKSDHRFFAETYLDNRAEFRALLTKVKDYWPEACLKSHPLRGFEDQLTTEVIEAAPLRDNDLLLMLSCGLHGIEGYIGNAVIRLFAEEYLHCLNPETTGLIFASPINPWGMDKRRRVNENNVDLNRNFIYDPQLVRDHVNARYSELELFLNPPSPLKQVRGLFFFLQLLGRYVRMGSGSFREAVHMGQYVNPKGLYYGGKSFEESAVIMNNIFYNTIEPYKKVLFIDMHSGYGPRYQMTLVNSVHESRASGDLVKEFNYPLVVKTNPEEFYQMQGDMIDYFYLLMKDLYPEKPFYATSFEFGTYGDSLPAALKSLEAMINENRVYHYGAVSAKAAEQAIADFSELFYPLEEKWRLKAISDARQAFHGILKEEGFINGGS